MANTMPAHAVFLGRLDPRLPANNQKVTQSGYAGIRMKEPPLILLKKALHDVSIYRYLKLRVKGDSKQWMVNLR